MGHDPQIGAGFMGFTERGLYLRRQVQLCTTKSAVPQKLYGRSHSSASKSNSQLRELGSEGSVLPEVTSEFITHSLINACQAPIVCQTLY